MAAQFPHQSTQILHRALYYKHWPSFSPSFLWAQNVHFSYFISGNKTHPTHPKWTGTSKRLQWVFFLREWVNRKVQTRRNVRNLTYFSRESESTHDLHLLDTSEKHLSVVKHKNHGQLCQYILQKVIKVLEAQNCTWIEYGGFYVFFSPSKQGLCVVSTPFIGLSHSQAAKD